MSWHDAADDDLNHFRLRRVLSSSFNGTAATSLSYLEASDLIVMGTIDNERIALYLENLPLPYAAYKFSYQ